MYYYLTVRYDIGSLALADSSHLEGPFQTTELREVAINEEANNSDCEEEVVNVTLLKVGKDGKLVHEQSFLLGSEEEEDVEDLDEEDMVEDEWDELDDPRRHDDEDDEE